MPRRRRGPSSAVQNDTQAPRTPWITAICIFTGSFALACGSVHTAGAPRGPVASSQVVVKVEAPRGVSLWHADPGAERIVCAAPCSEQVDVGGRYEARVADLPDSPTFEIPASQRGAIVRVEPGPPVLPGLGVVTGTVGAAAMVIGGAFALGDLLGDEDLAGAALPGGIVVAAGGAVLAAGIVLAALSGTHVDVREALRQPGTVRF